MSHLSGMTQTNKSLSPDSGCRYFPGLTTDELTEILRFTQLVLTQAASLPTPEIQPFPPNYPYVVRFKPDELKERALRYLSSLPSMEGAKYLIAMLQTPLHRYHVSLFVYGDVLNPGQMRDFTNEAGVPLSGISISDYPSLYIPATDQRTLSDISKRLLVIREQREQARCDNDFGLIDDLCDEEESLLSYVSKALAKLKTDDRAHKDYQIVLKAINRVVKKIRSAPQFKDAEVADYLKAHIRTGLYCYWDE